MMTFTMGGHAVTIGTGLYTEICKRLNRNEDIRFISYVTGRSITDIMAVKQRKELFNKIRDRNADIRKEVYGRKVIRDQSFEDIARIMGLSKFKDIRLYNEEHARQISELKPENIKDTHYITIDGEPIPTLRKTAWKSTGFSLTDESKKLLCGKPIEEINICREMGWLGFDDEIQTWEKANPAILFNKFNGLEMVKEREVDNMGKASLIEKVIFNEPATIVFWKDGTKTVVKAIDEPFDPEKGLSMAFVKRLHGNKGSYNNEIKKWTRTYGGPEKVGFSQSDIDNAWTRFNNRIRALTMKAQETGLGKSEAKYCENDVVMTKEVYEELGKAETWTKVKGYSNYELSSFGNIRNATTLKEVAIKWKTNSVPYVMLYNRKLGRSIRVYIKDIK